IENLLNPSPVSASIPQTDTLNISTSQASSLNNPQDDFNRSVGIDYSTPPKFIDYDVPNINDNLESTANKSIDINAIKDNAQDINVEREATDVNEFLNVAP